MYNEMKHNSINETDSVSNVFKGMRKKEDLMIRKVSKRYIRIGLLILFVRVYYLNKIVEIKYYNIYLINYILKIKFTYIFFIILHLTYK